MLVVEDDEIVRTLVVDALRELDYVTHAVSDGPAALRWLDTPGRVDLLLSDIGLPGGLSGKELALRARRRRPGLQVLLMTGYGQDQGYADFGTDNIEVIGKPFLIDVLLRRVEDMTRPAG